MSMYFQERNCTSELYVRLNVFDLLKTSSKRDVFWYVCVHSSCCCWPSNGTTLGQNRPSKVIQSLCLYGPHTDVCIRTMRMKVLSNLGLRRRLSRADLNTAFLASRRTHTVETWHHNEGPAILGLWTSEKCTPKCLDPPAPSSCP